MAVDPIAAHGPSPFLDMEDAWKRRAGRDMGTTQSTMLVDIQRWWSRATASSGTSIIYGSGASAVVASARQLTTAAAANSGLSTLAAAVATVGTAQNILTGNVQWWMGGYFKVSSAIGATTQAGIGATTAINNSIVPPVPELLLGVYGPTSTTNFVLWGAAGTAIDSGVAIDTNFHSFYAWRDGATSYVQVDSNAPASGTAAPSAASNLLLGHVFEVAATLRTVDLVATMFARPRP